jgi:formate-dependent nitrite reductase membrane component NrfD
MCVVYALLSGIGATILLTLALRGSSNDFGFLAVLEASLIIFTLVLLFAYLLSMLSSTASGKRSAQLVLRSRLGRTFWGGVIVAGLIIPLVITLFAYFALPAAVVATGLLLIVAAILELAGALLFRYTLLKAGVYPAQI